MIKLFEVSGFKNFKDKVTLDFSDVREYSFNRHCITNNLLSKVIIYGKNAVGKSNLGLALFDIVTHLTSKNVTPSMYNYYLNASNINNYVDFHYIFQFGTQIIDYSYHKDEKQVLIYEKLILDNNILFEYDYKLNKGNTEGIKN